MDKEALPYFKKPSEHETPPMIINEISRLFAAKMRECESEMQRESVRLIIISLAHRQGVTQLDIVKKTHLSPPTVSITLKRLEEQGYISRVTDAVDQRAVRVYLTEKGQQMNLDSLHHAQKVDSILMKDITENEKELLLGLLRRMRSNILNDFGIEGED